MIKCALFLAGFYMEFDTQIMSSSLEAFQESGDTYSFDFRTVIVATV